MDDARYDHRCGPGQSRWLDARTHHRTPEHSTHEDAVERPRVAVFHEVALHELDLAGGALQAGVADEILEEIHARNPVAQFGEREREISGGAGHVADLRRGRQVAAKGLQHEP